MSFIVENPKSNSKYYVKSPFFISNNESQSILNISHKRVIKFLEVNVKIVYSNLKNTPF